MQFLLTIAICVLPAICGGIALSLLLAPANAGRKSFMSFIRRNDKEILIFFIVFLLALILNNFW